MRIEEIAISNFRELKIKQLFLMENLQFFWC